MGAYLRAAKARADLSIPFAFFLAFLLFKIARAEFGPLAIMSAYFAGFLNAKLVSVARDSVE